MLPQRQRLDLRRPCAAAPWRAVLARRPCRPAASLAQAEPVALQQATLGRGLPSSASGPGVYAVYDAAAQLRYIGASRDVYRSLSTHAAALPDLAHSARLKLLGAGASRATLQGAWKGWITEHGSVPDGNATGGDPRWTAAAPVALTAAGRTKAAPAPPPRAPVSLEVEDYTCADADAVVTQAAFERLCSHGFVVLDGAFSEEVATQARAAGDLLLAAGRLRDIPSQVPLGRTDETLVMDVLQDGRLILGGAPGGGEALQGASPAAAAGLARVAALLKGLPAALQRCRRGEADVPGSTWPPALAPPQSLQLAVYPAAGTRYARHIDNDPDATGASDGPAGQRVSDRSVTCIAYLNPSDWAAEDGGQLRVFLPSSSTSTSTSRSGGGGGGGGSGSGASWQDVEPLGGRLVIFQSALVEHEVLPAFRRRWALSAWVPRFDAFDR